MADTLWPRISELVARSLELPTSERTAFLMREAQDTTVREEAASLVYAEVSREDPLQRLGSRIPRPRLALQTLEPPMLGRRIGPWRLLQLLGRGGMGTVYLAERADGAFEQRVALKLLRAPLLGAEGERRFTVERRILARLGHPAIARLLDGGILDDGVPWFAMEYVAGVPITQACDVARMDVSERLELFLRVCDAVDYAHRNLVVHRDLKPGNVLVTPEGEVKLLDFGVATLLDEDDRESADLHPLTPAYAAPEQRRGGRTTMATDVWALGGLLHELLVGHRPRSAQLGESGPARLRRRLARDLDAIVQKALDAVPERRYRSAAQLADDLRRHRDRLPVMARPRSPGYRLGRFMARHRERVAATVAIAVLVLALTGSGIHSDQRSRAEARRLALERHKAEAVSELLLRVVSGFARERAGDESVAARRLLDRGARWVRDELTGSPHVRTSVLRTLARAYRSRGLHGRADALDSEAMALRRRAGSNPERQVRTDPTGEDAED